MRAVLHETPWYQWAILAGLLFIGWEKWEATTCPIPAASSCADPLGILSPEAMARCLAGLATPSRP